MKAMRRLTTARSADKILKQIHAEMERIKVRKDHREIMIDAARNRCALRFQIEQDIDGHTYRVVVVKLCESQERVQDNLAALQLWLRNRNLSIERKIETLEEAYGAHVDVKMSELPPGFGKHLLAINTNPGLMGPSH